MERGFARVPAEEATEARRRIANILARAKPPPSNLHFELCQVRKSLQKRKNLLILPADKGRTTVVLDKEDYDRKMFGMLNDEKTYKQLDRDPVPSLEGRMNAFLLQLKKKGSITPDIYNRLRTSGGLTPYLYGLPKVHKPDALLFPSSPLPPINSRSI